MRLCCSYRIWCSRCACVCWVRNPDAARPLTTRIAVEKGAPTDEVWSNVVADAQALYLAWERSPWKRALTDALGGEVHTQCGVRITPDDQLDRVAMLRKECDASCVSSYLRLCSEVFFLVALNRCRLWPHLIIYGSERLLRERALASKQAAHVEKSMQDAWSKACMPYEAMVDAIMVRRSHSSIMRLTSDCRSR